jgi:hypothetical protein
VVEPEMAVVLIHAEGDRPHRRGLGARGGARLRVALGGLCRPVA